MNRYFILYCILTCSLLQGAIVETSHFEEIYDYIDPDTLIVLDIDNTLMRPVQQLGSDQWFYHRISHYQLQGYDSLNALEEALSEWMAVQNVTKMQLVEEGIADIVADLQKRGFTVMGLTTRGLGLSTRTVQQLKNIGIDLAKTSPTKDEIFFQNGRAVLFRSGILFTAGSHKGNAFCKLIDRIHCEPLSIVFMNDKRQNIEELEISCCERKYSFMGLRYGYIDEWVAAMDVALTDVQFAHFGHILSDEAARILLSNEPDAVSQ